MNRIVISIITIIICSSSSSAQNRTSLLQRINEIKSQNDTYYWDQYTHPNADTAKINATKRMLVIINSNRDEAAQLSLEEVTPHASYINIDRGNLKQYFVYIKRNDALSLAGGTSSSLMTSTPVIASPFNTPETMSPVRRSFVPEAFVQRVMEVKTFMNVIKLLKSLQSQGQVLQYGKLRDVEDYSSLDLILFDMKSQEIVTMLSPVTPSGNRINMVNGEEDSLDNYPTNLTAVIWFIRK